MKVEILVPSGGGLKRYTLSAGGTEGPFNFTKNGRRLGQFVDLLRADAGKVKDRRNSRAEISFSMRRSFANVGLAEDYVLTLDELVPRYGDVVFTSSSGNYVRTLPDALIENVSLSYMGIVVTMEWRIVGGRLVETDVTP